MLRNEKQVALDTVINSSRKSIEHYCWVAEHSTDERIKPLLEYLARQREAIVDKLAPQMYKLDDMPSMPDPEKLAVEEMITQIKAAFSENEKTVLLSSVDDIDTQLLQEIGKALELDFTEETIMLLQELQASALEAQRQIQSLSPANSFK